MNTDLPRFSQAAQQGERGVHVVSTIVFDEFGWIFKRNHQEHDFGIDGQIEVVTANNHVTGQLLAAQIKYGKSFFQEKNRWGYVYRGEQKHFNYLANYPIPVLIVLCHPESKECYWVRFLPHETQPAGDNWKVTVPFENILRDSKAKIEALLPPLKDHREALEAYWAVNNLLAESDYLHFIIDRPEVEAMDATRTREFFDHLRVTKELALENQGKVELSIFGYEYDPRELFEIPEVREYISILAPALPELFFFARTQQPTSTLKTFALCQTDVSWFDGRSTRLVTKQIVYDTHNMADFLARGYAGLNEMTEWLSLPLEENIRISADVARCLGIREQTHGA
jgi:hypothetical protein